MPVFDAGVFLAFILLGFGSLVLSFKLGHAFKIIGAMGFFAMSIVMLADYDVAFASTEVIRNSTSGALISNQTNYHFIIGDDNPGTESYQSWLGWMFMGLGIFASVLFFWEMVKLR